jgi:chromosome partitioning protein
LKNLPADLIIVDTPPYNTNSLPGLLDVSDLVIIPTKAGYPDIMAISRTIGFVKEAKLHNPKLKAGIVVNMIKPRSALTANIKEALAGYNLPIMAEIRDRVSYSRSVMMGGIEATGDQLAIDELTGLMNNILEML